MLPTGVELDLHSQLCARAAANKSPWFGTRCPAWPPGADFEPRSTVGWKRPVMHMLGVRPPHAIVRIRPPVQPSVLATDQLDDQPDHHRQDGLISIAGVPGMVPYTRHRTGINGHQMALKDWPKRPMRRAELSVPTLCPVASCRRYYLSLNHLRRDSSFIAQSTPGGIRTPNPRFRRLWNDRRNCQAAQHFGDFPKRAVPTVVPDALVSVVTYLHPIRAATKPHGTN